MNHSVRNLNLPKALLMKRKHYGFQQNKTVEQAVDLKT